MAAVKSVRVVDHGYKALAKRLLRMRKPVIITVGIHEEEGSEPEGDSGITVAEVAAMHELGLGQEQRSFVRAYVDRDEASLRGELRQAASAVIVKGGELDVALDAFGKRAAAGMQEFVTSGSVQPPNAPSTIARKGSAIPLIETGNMVSKITHRVKK